MKLEYIITLANKPVELMFLVMERSLRATGCELPVKVIPYDDRKFDLPANCEWWEDATFLNWIDHHGNRPVMRKYQALLASNFQFVDTDVVFLQNPQTVLQPYTGWINSCTHWHNPGHTLTPELLAYLKGRSSVWQWRIFNTGQFACDRALYDRDSLITASESVHFRKTVLENLYHEQPGINLLVNLTNCPITNLTLPPHCMESTWAGDYLDAHYRSTWSDHQRTPYLIHWAGRKIDGSAPIDELALKYFTTEERQAWTLKNQPNKGHSILPRIKRAIKAGIATFNDV